MKGRVRAATALGANHDHKENVMHPAKTLGAVTALVLALGACGGGGGGTSSSTVPGAGPGTPPTSPSPRINTEARLADQSALEKVRPQELWRTHQVTGHGVRIAIEDDTVDILEEEFEGRIAREGTQITLTYFPQAAYERFRRGELRWGPTLCPEGWRCRQFNVRSYEDGERRVQQALREAGAYPEYDSRQAWVIRVTDDGNAPDSDDSAPYFVLADPHTQRGIWEHGTLVASTAAGARYGVAPGATIVPKAITLGRVRAVDAGARSARDDLLEFALYEEVTDRRGRDLVDDVDRLFADVVTEQRQGADIVNQSYGVSSWGDWDLHRQHGSYADFYDTLDRRMPLTSRALQQAGVAESQKTFYVTAAGNNSDWEDRTLPQPGAAMALFYPELRGLAFAVAALGEEGKIAAYSNRCGSRDRYTGEFAWNAQRHGRHYCLAAPGTVNAANPDGGTSTVQGTSFAAPIVSGGLALLTEHFRGQMTPREIGLRMMNTADNEGEYATAEIYGAGVLDLEAALSPVGTPATGLPGGEALVSATSISLPPAYGDVAGRLGQVEVATFDEWNAPFWVRLGAFVGAVDSEPLRLSDLSTMGASETPVAWRGLAWTPAGTKGLKQWSFAYASDPQGELNAGGLSYASMEGRLHTGLVFEQGSVMGGRGEGAFEGEALHGLVFGSYRRDWTLGRGIRLEATGTLVGGGIGGTHGMLREARALYSAGKVSLSREDTKGVSRVSVEQPLRAESGTLRFKVPSGRTAETGRWLYREVDVGVEPSARAVALAVGRKQRVGKRARLGVEWRTTFDAGHVSGETRNEFGAMLRVELP